MFKKITIRIATAGVVGVGILGLKTCVVELKARATQDDAIRLNPDRIGRVRCIHREPYSPDELRTSTFKVHK